MLPTELKQAILNLQSALNNEEKVSLASFASKLHQTLETHPEDQTIGQMSLVVDRMNSGNRLFISQAEIKDLYQKLYSRNTKFKEIFAQEMGIDHKEISKTSPTEQKYQEFDIYQDTDKSLLASLNSAWNPNSLPFSNEIAKEAEKVVERECSFQGLAPTVKAVSGDENIVVVQASYLTPKGTASFFVPVEIMGKNASIPSFFTGKDGQHYISKKSIAKYVSDFFNKVGSYGNETVGEELQTANTTTNEAEVESFASQLSSTKGVAAFQHGDLVEKGRRVISQKLRGFGKNSHQVNVLDADKDTIIYGVSCNGLAFKVPVKIEAGRMSEPAFVLCRGSIEDFSGNGLANLEKANLTDDKVAAVVSPMFALKPSDLVETVRVAAEEGNYAKAEDALNILANMEDTKAYQVAFSEYTTGLSAVKKEASVVSKCSRMIKSANSTQPICSHLNLPAHKVYQDKNGDCRPLTRKGEDQGYEGAHFMNSKILF